MKAKANCISASAMRSEEQKLILRFIFSVLVVLSLVIGHWSLVIGEIRDRVVAYIDDTAITLSELEMKYAETLKVIPNTTKEDVLNTMINRSILLREAKKIRLESPSEDELLREYIDLRIRTFILIKDEELFDFHEKHLEDFQGEKFEAVRAEIEKYLIEKKINERLKLHILELREDACIKIDLNKDPHRNPADEL
ncbi:MAG: SurA N-terminal domain-containing protein [Nitrospirae bacterium]|nr:SurA N-terminal domain-containing protein [Nitrospirota bacterium]